MSSTTRRAAFSSRKTSASRLTNGFSRSAIRPALQRRTDGRSPRVAPVAKQQGQYVADLILGRRKVPFAYRDFGNLATIGRSKAVIDWGRLQLSGFAAWLIWSVAHIWFLVGFRSRIAVAISWLWSYATYQRSARLITGETPPTSRQPRSVPTLERKCA